MATSLKVVFFCLLILCESMLCFVGLASSSVPWLEGYDYRKSHVISQTVGAGENYQVNLTVFYGAGTDYLYNVYLDGNCQSDFSDIRFTESDGQTELYYWREIYVASSYGFFWVNMTDNLSLGDVTFYLYYGNDTVCTTSDHLMTMIRSDNGTTGNFQEQTEGDASFSHGSGSYTLTSDSIDDAFASGYPFSNWNFSLRIRVFEEFTGAGLFMFGFFDEDTVADITGDIATSAPKRRFIISRYSQDEGDYPNRIVVAYWNTLGNEAFWDGDSWTGTVQRFETSGDLEYWLYSDGTNIICDIFESGVSIFDAPASVAISSVKTFSDGYTWAWSDLYNQAYYGTQNINRYFCHKFVLGVSHGAWGEEETSIITPIDELALALGLLAFIIAVSALGLIAGKKR